MRGSNNFDLTFPLPAQCATLHQTPALQTLTYHRLDDNLLRTNASDAVTGYFLGSYGVHGPEVLHLQRAVVDGSEAVVAHKITGVLLHI